MHSCKENDISGNTLDKKNHVNYVFIFCFSRITLPKNDLT
jgi:hypothetical protein